MTELGQSPKMDTMPPTELLTAAQAADHLNVNRRTITRWADADRLPVAMRLPGATGAVLFRRSDVEALRDSLAGEPVEAAS